MARLQHALTRVAFIADLMPDLLRTGRALYSLFDGDVQKARSVLEVVRDHGARLDAARADFDAELARLRAVRAKEVDA